MTSISPLRPVAYTFGWPWIFHRDAPPERTISTGINYQATERKEKTPQF